MIMNAFVFLYLKLTRNWWNKVLKWNYMHMCYLPAERSVYEKKTIVQGTQFWEHKFFTTDLGRKKVY